MLWKQQATSEELSATTRRTMMKTTTITRYSPVFVFMNMWIEEVDNTICDGNIGSLFLFHFYFYVFYVIFFSSHYSNHRCNIVNLRTTDENKKRCCVPGCTLYNGTAKQSTKKELLINHAKQEHQDIFYLSSQVPTRC